MTELRAATAGSELSRLAHWDGLVAELAAAVIVTDVAGRVVIWNRAATKLFGWRADEALGRAALGFLLPRQVELDAIAVAASVAAGRRWVGDVECKRRDGSRTPIHMTLSSVYDDARHVIGFVAEAHDVSDLEAAECHGRDAERLFRSLLMREAEVVSVTDSHGVVKYLVQSNESVLEYSTEELHGTSGFDLAHPDDEASLRNAFALTVADPTARPVVVYRARAKDGTWRWREMRLSNHLDDPIIAGIVCNISDATEQQELVRELRGAGARQRAIGAHSRDATLFFDMDGTIRWASPGTPGLLCAEPDSLVGQNGLNFVHPDDQERVLEEFMSMGEFGHHIQTEFRVTDLAGATHWIEEDATNLVDDPDIGYVVANIREITDRKRAQDEAEQLTLHDRLTGLPTRSLLVNRLERLLARGAAATVVYINIDNLRDVNDSLGHAAGDEVLCLIGRRLASAVARSEWTVARVGGDEFVLLCDDVGDATTALTYAERLREEIRVPVQLAGQEVFVTASIGVALNTGDATGLMRDAGTAMYQAKRHGRDRVVVFDAGLDITQRHRLVVQGQLRHALARDELVVWHQPMIDLQTDRVAGVEALVRWNHPVRGLLGPEHFIDVAETSGLIRVLGSQVLRKACADAQMWEARGCRLRISVNAAAAQLNSLEYVAEIENALAEFELDPDRVTIEITETAVMQVPNSLDTLRHIRRLGLHLALDDFGTGYSSLSFLRELPVDAIKIDRSFVGGMGVNQRDTAIVHGVIAMAAALGHAVVAEGVETTAQAEMLRHFGCRYAQGFLWSRPVPADEIEDAARCIERDLRSVR